MIIITRTYKTLSPSGGCHNYIHHKETKCFDDDDKKGIEEYLNMPVSVLREREFGYDIYSLNYDVKKL
jgi:hypothetical protein